VMVDFGKKDTMTLKKRIDSLILGKPLDRVPFNPCSLGFSARVYGIDRGEFYRNPEKAFAAGMHLLKLYPWMNASPVYGWADRGTWEFGGKINWPDNNRYIAPSTEPLFTDPSDIDSLQ